jgi:FkbM family methyltransferase
MRTPLVPGLNTRTKIALARILYRALHFIRALFGLGDSVVTQRDGIRWHLDLRQGIDLSIYLFGYFERDMVRTYRRLLGNGDVVLDIGANIGAHTLPLARCVGETGCVYAFEPTEFAYRKLRANAALNTGLNSRIRAEQVMLVADPDAATSVNVYSSWPVTPSAPGTHPKHLGVPMPTTNCRAMTLDAFVAGAKISRVDLIKMDVDGNECAVLRGAQNTLARFHPPLLMELMPYGLEECGTSLARLLEILRGHGYRLYTLGGSPLPDTEDVSRHIPAAGGINVLCRRDSRSGSAPPSKAG